MERTTINAPNNVVERNIRLTGELMRYLLEHPQIFRMLPDRFEVVILPDDDPEMRLYNLELLDKYTSEGTPIVFVRLHAHRDRAVYQQHYLKLYAPIAA
ncbi:MAG: hypothetical protein ONB05_06085 [candidate division KSB1 bacterium]|nr:hypothetical protein [candidate division KSB1 bacterium]